MTRSYCLPQAGEQILNPARQVKETGRLQRISSEQQEVYAGFGVALHRLGQASRLTAALKQLNTPKQVKLVRDSLVAQVEVHEQRAMAGCMRQTPQG
jgi:hypothetical protein